MRARSAHAALIAAVFWLTDVQAIERADLVAHPRLAHRPALFKDSRQALAIARAQGRSEVALLLMAIPGKTDTVAREATRRSGDIRYRSDDVGYLRVRIPINQATSLAESAAVEAATIDVNDTFPLRFTHSNDASTGGSPRAHAKREEGTHEESPWPPRLSDYPLRNPYSPLADLDAKEIRAQHPTWDGRGVTIAVLDGNYDMLIPELQTAYALDGRRVPKTADYFNTVDPRDETDLYPQWVDMRASVTSKGRTLAFHGKKFRVPRDETYRVGFFNERGFDSPYNAAYIGQDIDRNGNPEGDDGLFGVLWNEQTNDVWVDTNRDLDFGDEVALTDYGRRPIFGVFGKDDPATAIRESVGFAVQTDRKNKFVAINVGIHQHASEIVGAVVGNREPRGLVEGIAPGARMVSIFWGVSSYGMAEALIAAFKHPKVDLIVLEQSTAIASETYALADARHPISILIQRLIDKFDKLVFVPGGNSAGFGYVGEDGLAAGAVSVGGYQSAESYRLNVGITPASYDNLHWGALSHGPGNAGSLKPDLLAPSGQMSTEVVYQEGALRKGLFHLPAGYEIGGGTSTAAPMAAGAAALVLSAAKQSGIRYNARTLKAALTGSARYISTLPAYEQGNGLIQVAPAIDLLRQLDGKTIRVTSSAPVRHKLSSLYVIPDRGYGIYEREGWKVGDRGEREITLTRISGPSQPMTFSLKWLGNSDHTFSSLDSVTLPLNKPVNVPVSISVDTEGAHAAILALTHPAVPGVVHSVLNTIVVPYHFSRENGHTIEKTVTPPIPGDLSFFVDVPPSVSALTVKVDSDVVGLSLQSPSRDTRWLAGCGPMEGGMNNCSFRLPEPGVWEVNLHNEMIWDYDPDFAIPLKAAPVTVTVSVVDVSVKPALRQAELSGDASGLFSVTFQNRLAAVNAGAGTAELNSAFQSQATLSQGEQHLYEIWVPAGATSLRAAVAVLGDASADLDLYLMDCTAPDERAKKRTTEEGANKNSERPAPPCGVRAKSDSTEGNGEVEMPSPKEGRWVVVVDAYRVPRETVRYQYLDMYAHPRFGTLSVTDIVTHRAPDSEWTAKGNAWIAERPEPPRTLYARLCVKSDVIVQKMRTAEGFDESDMANWYVPIGSTDPPIH